MEKLGEQYPRKFAFTKFHLTNTIRDDDDNRVERVCTETEFLEMCGAMNKEYGLLLKAKEVLATLLSQTPQPPPEPLLSDDLLADYNRLVYRFNEKKLAEKVNEISEPLISVPQTSSVAKEVIRNFESEIESLLSKTKKGEKLTNPHYLMKHEQIIEECDDLPIENGGAIGSELYHVEDDEEETNPRVRPHDSKSKTLIVDDISEVSEQRSASQVSTNKVQESDEYKIDFDEFGDSSARVIQDFAEGDSQSQGFAALDNSIDFGSELEALGLDNENDNEVESDDPLNRNVSSGNERPQIESLNELDGQLLQGIEDPSKSTKFQDIRPELEDVDYLDDFDDIDDLEGFHEPPSGKNPFEDDDW